jgi:septal ring factor EnvC (AmiA/AmiB activator)
LRVLFDGSAPARVAEEYDYLGRIVRRDRGLLALYRQQLEDLGAVMAHLGDLRSKQLNLLAALQRQRDDLHQAGKLKEQLLARARRDRTALALSLDTLRDRAESLSALIKKLETAKPRGYTQKSDSQSPFGREKGQLPWPLTGEILSGFGTRKHPEIGALYDSQGIEIAATGESAAITAVWDGQVVFANWFKGYGNLLILDHGDSYHTLYAQASRLTRKIGDRVARGEPVGISGSEGAVGVYFEIRHGGTPLNPTAWLIPRKKS